MGSLLVELVPFAVGLAITPTAVATVILLLSSRRPVANTLAFAAPFALVYAVVAVIVLVAAGAATSPLLTEREKHVASLAVGLVLLALGVGSVVRRRRARAAQHAAKPGMLARIDSAAPPAAFGIGLGLALLNPNLPILLGGLAAVAAAEVSQGGRVVGAAFLVVWSEVGLVGPLLWFLLDRERATRGLKRLKDWLGRHEHAVDLAVLFGFGAVFTFKGLAGL